MLDSTGDRELMEFVFGIGTIVVGAAGTTYQYLSHVLETITRAPEKPYPLLPYPNPDRHRLHLGNPETYGGTPGDVPHGTPGFNLDRLVPPTTNTGQESGEESKLENL
jgi:hypothetical protein